MPDMTLDTHSFGQATSTGRPVFSVVVPCYNEALGLQEFHRRLSAVMNGVGRSWEVVYVNDGSPDGTLACIEGMRATDPHIGLINLSRNFGKEIALTAGLDHAQGEAIIVTDAALQAPPEVIPDLVAVGDEGVDMVYAQRRAREGETWAKKVTADLFYRLMQRIGGVRLPRNTGDFRLLSRRALD